LKSLEFIKDSCEKGSLKIHENNLNCMEDFDVKGVNIKKANYDIVFSVTAGELFEASTDPFVTKDVTTGLILELNGKEYKRKEYNITVIVPKEIKLGDV
jgi:hypothetical protein